MARLSESQLEAIRAHLIKDELDSFGITLKSTYPDASNWLSSFEQLVADPGEC